MDTKRFMPWEISKRYDAVKKGSTVLGVKPNKFDILKKQGYEIKEVPTVEYKPEIFPQDIGSKEKPVDIGAVPLYKKDGFWFFKSGDEWFRVTDPRTAREYDVKQWKAENKPVPPEVLAEYPDLKTTSIIPEKLQDKKPHEIHWGIAVNDQIATSGTMVGTSEGHLAELAKGYKGRVVFSEKTFSKKQEVGDIFGYTFEQIKALQQKTKLTKQPPVKPTVETKKSARKKQAGFVDLTPLANAGEQV